MRPMTPEEDAAFRLGDSAHMRAFIEDAAVRILLGLYSANFKKAGTSAPPDPSYAATAAAVLWDAVETEIRKRAK